MNRILGLRLLTILSAVLAYFQASLGGIVRVSGSGEGCSGWPLCSGHPWPNPNLHSVIEFSHRTNGTLLGFAVLATFLLVVTKFRDRRPLVWLATAALVLVAFEGAVGGTVVIAGLEGFLVLFHFGTALIILGLLLTLAFSVNEARPGVPDPAWRRRVDWVTVLAFVMLLSGSSVVATNADNRCQAWPLCGNGFGVDLSGVVALNYLHRGLVLVAALLILHVAATAWRRWGQEVPGLRAAAVITAGLLVLQVADGAVLAWTREMAFFTGLHVALAAAVWAALVSLTLLSHPPLVAAVGQRSLAWQGRPT